MKYRRRMDILSDMLQIAESGAMQTRIMYGTNTSHTKVKEYLKQLIDSKLLTYDTKKRMYHTTEEGTKFLRRYLEMKHLLSPRK
jgi:predicted transcriptional regulator